MSSDYDFKKIEAKWQQIWEKKKPFRAEDFAQQEKAYFLVEFPYPSGAGLHLGHPRSYTALDIMARKARMEGKNVLYPIGWDSFGLPTENYAIKTNRPPQEITNENIETFRRQLKSLGISFDWEREVNTSDSSYYKWTQWIFLQLYKKGLAYKDSIVINWCPSCKIGLANEEVIAGKCERCGAEVEKREREQWLLAITKYADRLLADLDTVDYLEKIKVQQKNWIGRKEWIDIKYPIEGSDRFIEVSTTRPDTNFGATFIVVAPEHQFLQSDLIPESDRKQVNDYIDQAKRKTEEERIAEGRQKSGIFTAVYALNPLNNQKLPIWVADFVLPTVGTGAVVGVPGHDRRDFEFAHQFKLPIIRVVVGADGDQSEISRIEQVQEEAGTMINSDFLNGLEIKEAISKIRDFLEEKGWGKKTIRYHLRDWIFSRQRYWGEPIPIIYCRKCWEGQRSKVKGQKLGKDYIVKDDVKYAVVPVSENQLPIKLPIVENYQPTDTGESPLAKITDWVNTQCPICQSIAFRETDTMPNWAGSSWYFLRYADPVNDQEFANKKKLEYWTPVDLYNGGMEHTTLHLLYSRFWHKFLFDQGLVPSSEPYRRRVSQGLILATDGQKMSKSKGNVINPDDLVKEYGADSLRLFEMFIGPFDQPVSWQEDGIRGTQRFLQRVCRFKAKVAFRPETGQEQRQIHQLIQKITNDIDKMQFNTAVSSLMEYLNRIESQADLAQANWQIFLQLLFPFAPHLALELWSQLNLDSDLNKQPWPSYDETLTKEQEITYIVQINGKFRGSLILTEDLNQKEVEAKVQKEENVIKFLENKEIKRIIFVKGKLINFVI